MRFFGTDKKQDKEPEDKDEEQQEQEEDTYSLNVECENCEEPEDYDISFGTPVFLFLKDKKCEMCGCKVLQPTRLKQNNVEDE